MENLTPEVGRFPGQMCQATAACVDRLKEGSWGNTLSREQMAAIIGRPCSPGSLGYGNVLTAIKHVLDQYQVAWEWQRPTQVWLCLDDSGKVNLTTKKIKGTRRAARRAAKVVESIDPSQLNLEDKRDHALNLSVTGMVSLCVSGAFRRRVAKLEGPRPLVVGKLIELMGGNAKDQNGG